MRKIALLLVCLMTFTLFGCSNGNTSNSIKEPKKLDSSIESALSEKEQSALQTFVVELIESYNNGDNENYLKITDELEDAFSEIKSLAKSADELSDVSQKGFLIMMTALTGMVSPGEDSTPEEVREYLKEKITEIIDIYYE